MKGKTIIIAACLVLMGCIHAWAFEEFESPDGKVVEIKSQEELTSLMNETDINNNTVYILVPTSSTTVLKNITSKCIRCSSASNKCCCYNCYVETSTGYMVTPGRICGSTCPTPSSQSCQGAISDKRGWCSNSGETTCSNNRRY